LTLGLSSLALASCPASHLSQPPPLFPPKDVIIPQVHALKPYHTANVIIFPQVHALQRYQTANVIAFTSQALHCTLQQIIARCPCCQNSIRLQRYVNATHHYACRCKSQATRSPAVKFKNCTHRNARATLPFDLCRRAAPPLNAAAARHRNSTPGQHERSHAADISTQTRQSCTNTR
jgi:hypothetical protein